MMIIIFFLPYISDNFPAIGVMTAPATRYAVSIQEELLYDISKSLMILGIAGRSIVSPYIVTNREEPRMPSMIHAECGIFARDRKSTRLNSSHANISYAVFCLKK